MTRYALHGRAKYSGWDGIPNLHAHRVKAGMSRDPVEPGLSNVNQSGPELFSRWYGRLAPWPR